MHKVVPKEGPCAPLFYSVAAILVLSANAAIAQTVELSSLEQCARLETQALKLACFEAIIANGRASNPLVPDSGPAETPEIASAPLPEAEPMMTREYASIADVVPETAPKSASTKSPVDAPTSVSETLAPAVDADPQRAESQVSAGESAIAAAGLERRVEEFGAEQLPDANRDADLTITETVVEVRRGYNRTLSFHMESGQIWRQVEPRRLQYPRNEAFEVVISRGMLGDYRLRIGEKGRLVKIRRIQ